jgi:hypothetical protein
MHSSHALVERTDPPTINKIVNSDSESEVVWLDVIVMAVNLYLD